MSGLKLHRRFSYFTPTGSKCQAFLLTFQPFGGIITAVKPKNPPKRHTYTKLGRLLKDARNRLYDEHTGGSPRVEDMAKQLGVTIGFVYQVEQGKRKPKDGDIARWASVYGVRYVDLWKCLNRIPMDLVATLRGEPEPAPGDPFSQLTEDEKSELLPFLNFVRWKIVTEPQRASPSPNRLG